jgi:hypothetical protein
MTVSLLGFVIHYDTPSAGEPQLNLGVSPAKTQRSERTVKIICENILSFPSELGDFAPWREEFPTPSTFSFQIICAGRANFEL